MRDDVAILQISNGALLQPLRCGDFKWQHVAAVVNPYRGFREERFPEVDIDLWVKIRVVPAGEDAHVLYLAR